jgi:hypothetical protein
MSDRLSVRMIEAVRASEDWLVGCLFVGLDVCSVPSTARRRGVG